MKLAYFKHALAVLSWDEEVNMPPKGAAIRAETIGHLSQTLHDVFTSKKFEALIVPLHRQRERGKLSPKESIVVREVFREWKREKKLPSAFVKVLARTVSESHLVWVSAKQKSDFGRFEPYLRKIIDLKRQEAQYRRDKNHLYDALLDTYEPYMSVSEVERILMDLKSFLIPFIQRIKNSKIKTNPHIFFGKFSPQKQQELNHFVAEKIGFDFHGGRFDASSHPFTSGFHPHDVRFTTRYHEDDILYSLGSTMHEVGHALYEQGLPVEDFGTPLGESISLGIHESQSRLWENIIGRSRVFLRYFYPWLQKEFPQPFRKISLERFYEHFNHVAPSFIRTEADEVTYNLHIVMRFEMEKSLIEGTLEVQDLPSAWNAKMKEYFGLKVPNDTLGVLQDVHWSSGIIGYFPAYTLGNLYSAQFFAAAQRALPQLDRSIARGNFEPLNTWLRENIYIHGKTYTARELVVKVTGESLTSRYFTEYLEEKYGEIYHL